MIIADETPPSPSKSNATLQSPLLEPVSPPAYGAPPHQQYQPYNAAGSSAAYSSGPYSPLLPPNHAANTDLEANGSRRDSPAQRFWKAFAVAVLIYVLLGIFFGTFSISVHSYQSKKRWYDKFPIPSDIAVISCTRGTEMQNNTYGWSSPFSSPEFPLDDSSENSLLSSTYGSVQTSLSLPLSSDTLFFLSRGEISKGSMRIESSPNLADADTARVDVKMIYVDPRQGDHSDVLDQTTVCLVKRKGGKGKQMGVGLFSPRHWSSSPYLIPQIHYDVTLVLPESRGPSLTHLNAFETDLPNFQHVFSRSLDELVTFGRLLLKGGNGLISAVSLTADNATIHTSNAEIDIQSLKARTASLYTSNAQIKGHFTTSHSLEINGANTKVKASIDLAPQSGDKEGKVGIKTSNSFIEAVINVHEPSSSYSGLSFDNSSASSSSSSSSSPYSPTISTSTSNGYISLLMPLLPLNSALSLTASTTNGPMTAVLPATYEGSYSLSTTNGKVETEFDHTKDPAGVGEEEKAGLGDESIRAFVDV
ncbi:hypothetical protein BT96DRAFT_681003 [Gymnopus androsaceus JB14]|uniref:DUF7330 domain-containing protein n=1 Tax=Gymnopus androsaceus JB14 TaxID=1447944 RepID=A0A6A4HNZ6_9AGAR|nr:hypothetical protein BT96DRAFT_681003 [Gymnopus androsaceus JB14]